MYQRIIITVILTLTFFLLPAEGYVSGGFSSANFLYLFFHANIFHLLGNLLCLWMLRCPLHILVACIIAVAGSFLPTLTSEPTMGFSGVLFAIAGISWGRIGRFVEMCKRCLPFILITLFLPNVNALIHVYCLFLGYLYGLLKWNDPLNQYDPYNPSLVSRGYASAKPKKQCARKSRN